MNTGIDRIPYGQLRWDSTSSAVVIENCPWPRVATRKDNDSRVEAGPTGLPWVDSNGWLAEMARACLPGAEIRIELEAPKRTVTPAALALAVADCEAFGARCILPQGMDAPAAFRFFSRQPYRTRYAPAANIGVVSDFLGANQELAGEILNLSIRRTAQLRAIAKGRLTEEDLKGLRLAIYADQEPPASAVLERLTAFARNGGAVMAVTAWGKPAGRPAQADPSLDYDVRSAGKGSIAVARQAQDDAWRIAVDAQTIISRRNDPVRLWNAASMNCRYWRSADEAWGLIRIVNYAMRAAAHNVTVSISEPWRSATFQQLDQGAPVPLQLHPVSGGAELHLPPFAVYSEILLSKWEGTNA